jgi:NAD(P)H-flavin reductase
MSTTVDRLVPTWTTVAATRRETADTVTITVESDEPFQPGQFDMLTAFGVGEAPISHSGHPLIPGIHEHTIRSVGAISRALSSLGPGDTIGIRGPYGKGWPVDEMRDRDVVIVAGGVGLAPLRSLALAVESDPGAFRRVVLLVGARTPADIPFSADLSRWQASSALDVYVTVDRSVPGWDGSVGVVTRLLRPAHVDPDSLAVLCGPEVMMRFAAADLLDLGVDAGSIHVSLERNMECGIGLCGHCQAGAAFVCWKGPVMPWTSAADLMKVPEL